MTETQILYTLITGASSGIGRAIAERLSEKRRLILHGRDLQRLEDCRSHCAHPEMHLLWVHDLCDLEGLAPGLTKLLAEADIAVDCLVHSAAMLKLLPVRAVTHAAFNAVLNANLVSAAEIVSLLVKRRINRQQLKNVVFISSIASNFGAPGFSMYIASKSGLDGLMRALAVELAPGVRVNSILPGGIRTPMTTSLLENPEVADKLARDYPLGLGEVEDIVNAAEFLASKSSRWITGQQIVVDGGRSINISI
jgi:NAD(P)-dependent dehydrogenase (short-subunit alcohol dehydrogenase family)